jgi:hypothetical protein
VRGLVAVALTVVLAGCFVGTPTTASMGYPAEPTTLEYGLRDRCRPGGPMDCSDRALRVIDEIVGSLGPMVAPAEPSEPQASVPFPFVVEADRSEGWDWRSSDGDSGSTDRVRIDLSPYLEGFGSAELRFAEGGPAYAVPDDLAESLILAIYVRDP